MGVRASVNAAGFVVGSVMLAPLPALAGPAECASIVNAFAAMIEIPGYHQRVSARSGAAGDVIVIGNSLYLKGAEGWKAKTLPPQRRLEYLLPGFSEGGVEQCASAGPEASGGTMARRFQFTLRAGGQAREITLLLDLANGLIHRIEHAEGRVDLHYDRLMPPTP